MRQDKEICNIMHVCMHSRPVVFFSGISFLCQTELVNWYDNSTSAISISYCCRQLDCESVVDLNVLTLTMAAI